MEHETGLGTTKSYVIGLILSLLLTFASFFTVSKQWLQGYPLYITIGVLAIVQMVVQLVCFLHVGREGKPHWNTLSFAFMFLVMVVIVGGSLWIMYNLSERVMPTMEM